MTPAEYGAYLASKAPPLGPEQIEAAARILATVLIDTQERLDRLERRLEPESPPAQQPEPDRIWLNTREAAERAGKHRDTVIKALESGALHGHQRVPGGRWSMHADCVDAWASGAQCPRHRAEDVT